MYLYNKRSTDLLLESKSGQIAQIVAVYVVTGEADKGIPKEIILNLIDEYGKKFFNSEIHGFRLLPEHEEDVIR